MDELDMDDQGIDVLFAEAEDSDDVTTSGDDSNDYIDDGLTIRRKRRNQKTLCLEKCNTFIEATDSFLMHIPPSISPKEMCKEYEENSNSLMDKTLQKKVTNFTFGNTTTNL